MSAIITIPQCQNSAQKKVRAPFSWFDELQKTTRMLQISEQENIKLSYEIELLKAKLYVQQALAF